MTVPVISNVHMMEDGSTFEKDVETAFFLPAEFQSSPPQSYDPDVTIVYREPVRIIARSERHWCLSAQHLFSVCTCHK